MIRGPPFASDPPAPAPTRHPGTAALPPPLPHRLLHLARYTHRNFDAARTPDVRQLMHVNDHRHRGPSPPDISSPEDSAAGSPVLASDSPMGSKLAGSASDRDGMTKAARSPFVTACTAQLAWHVCAVQSHRHEYPLPVCETLRQNMLSHDEQVTSPAASFDASPPAPAPASASSSSRYLSTLKTPSCWRRTPACGIRWL